MQVLIGLCVDFEAIVRIQVNRALAREKLASALSRRAQEVSFSVVHTSRGCAMILQSADFVTIP